MWAKSLTTITLILATLSCSVFREKISSKDRDRVHKIAVYSDLGEQLNYQYAGATSLRDHSQAIPTPWKMDSNIEQNLLAALNQNKKYAQVEIVGSDITRRPNFDQMVTMKRNGAKIESWLDVLAAKGFDTLIIVQGWKQVEDANVPAGFGIYYNNRLLIHEQNFFLAAKVRVYDITKKKEVGSVDLWRDPYISLNDYPMRKTWQEWPTDHLATVGKLIDEKVVIETQDSIHRLGLD